MTGLTYGNRDEERDDRRQQESLLAALDAALSQLRRDECGWWVIGGRRGAFHTWGDGRTWLAYVRCRSRQHWTFTKRHLAFMMVTQNGEEEGCLRLSRLPTPDEAVVIREVMGLRKRVAYAPDTLERKRASMAKAGLARGAAGAPKWDADPLAEGNGRFPGEDGLAVERDVLEVEEELACAKHVLPRGKSANDAAGLAPQLSPDPSAANSSLPRTAIREYEDT